jgi:hypothetical protein
MTGITVKNCALVTDLSKYPKSILKEGVTQTGKKYYRVEFDLCMTLDTACMRFSLEIDGKEAGVVEADYGN